MENTLQKKMSCSVLIVVVLFLVFYFSVEVDFQFIKDNKICDNFLILDQFYFVLTHLKLSINIIPIVFFKVFIIFFYPLFSGLN